MKPHYATITLLLSAAASGLFGPPHVYAKVTPPPICVSKAAASGCPYSTIQDAVDNAPSGTTISLSGDTFVENVTINQGAKPPKLTLIIEGNGATIVDGGGIGSVFNIGPKTNITLIGMTIQNGVAQPIGTQSSAGGGVAALDDAIVTVSQCTITGNQANLGAGIIVENGDLTVSLSTITGNTVSGPSSTPGGGGIFFGSTRHKKKLLIEQSVISGNIATSGAGLQITSSGPLYASSATITGSTINDNSGGGLPTDDGTGIFLMASKLTMANSTVSGNVSGGATAAIANNQGKVTLNNDTIVDNTAAGTIGGIGAGAGAKTTLSNTILAANTDPSGEADCFGAFTSKDYNLIGESTCSFTGKASHNLLGVDPMLAPLANNGGSNAPLVPPATQAPLPGSPVLGAGNPATPNGRNGHCAMLDETGLLSNQRLKGDCAIGAYQPPN